MQYLFCVYVTYCGCDYRWGMEWWMDLLTTCIHHSKPHFISHWHGLVSSVYYSLHKSFPGNGFYRGRFFSFPHSCPLATAARAELMSTDNSTNWFPGWRPFHTNILAFSSQTDLHLNWTATELYNQTSYFTPLHSTELLTNPIAARLVSLLYNLGADPTETPHPVILLLLSWEVA
jgi:hypothetical protein